MPPSPGPAPIPAILELSIFLLNLHYSFLQAEKQAEEQGPRDRDRCLREGASANEQSKSAASSFEICPRSDLFFFFDLSFSLLVLIVNLVFLYFFNGFVIFWFFSIFHIDCCRSYFKLSIKLFLPWPFEALITLRVIKQWGVRKQNNIF